MATVNSIMLPNGQKDQTHAAVSAMSFSAGLEARHPDESPHDTAITNAFSMLLPILAEYVSAERDLEDVGFSSDPAYTNWHMDAERAQDRLIDVLHDLRTLRVQTSQDVPLRRIAVFLHAMRTCNAATARAIHQQMEGYFEAQLQRPSTVTSKLQRTLLMQWARPHIAAFAALPVFECNADDEAERVTEIAVFECLT